MQRHHIAAVMAIVAAMATATPWHDAHGAEVVISINKSNQTMAVLVDGVATHNWPVSTGLGGGPPSGSYRPQRLERKWFSRKYGWSPMPHSIFFHEGYAIHGTIYVSRLGRRASHGCVRLHPRNAAVLFELVSRTGKANTRIVVSNTSHVEARPAPVPVPASAPAASPPAASPPAASPPGDTAKAAVPAAPAAAGPPPQPQ